MYTPTFRVHLGVLMYSTHASTGKLRTDIDQNAVTPFYIKIYRYIKILKIRMLALRKYNCVDYSNKI